MVPVPIWNCTKRPPSDHSAATPLVRGETEPKSSSRNSAHWPVMALSIGGTGGAGGGGGTPGIVGGGSWTSEMAVLPPPPGQGTETGAGLGCVDDDATTPPISSFAV